MFDLPSSPWTFDIPAAPPSVNHYWGRRGNQYYIKAAGKAFRAMTEPIALAATGGFPLSLRVRLFCILEIRYPDRRGRDMDNAQKCVMDSISHALKFNDAQIDQIFVERIDVVKGAGGLTRVTLVPVNKARVSAAIIKQMLAE